MSSHVFITARARLNPRWQEAFDNAVYSTHADFSGRNCQISNAVYWLDISQVAPAERPILLKKVAQQVGKLMVMTDEQADAEAMLVMQSGAVGYCHYLAAPEQLAEIASVVANGGLWLGVQLMKKLLSAAALTHGNTQREKSNQAEADRAKLLQQLTPREKMVALEVGKGVSNKEIAGTLEITERTVKAHISVVFNKLGVGDRVKLALFMNNL